MQVRDNDRILCFLIERTKLPSIVILLVVLGRPFIDPLLQALFN